MNKRTLKKRKYRTKKRNPKNKTIQTRYTRYKKNRLNIKKKLINKTKSLINTANSYPFITAETISSYILQTPIIKRERDKICKKMKEFNIKC